jgi:cyclic beta-1,2-glucan synthetase
VGAAVGLEASAREAARAHRVAGTVEVAAVRARAGAARRALREAHRRFAGAAASGVPTSRAAEWVLDNDYVILEAARVLEESLPKRFERQLPALGAGPAAGRPRAEAVARAALVASGGIVDADRLARFVAAYQDVGPLTTGELWALPALLRLAVLEDLAEAAGAASAEPGEATGERVGRDVLGLREIAAVDWKEFVEAASPVDRVLAGDPAGAYPLVDFETRDAYRRAVEQVSRWSGRPEPEVAEAAVRLAAEAGEAAPRRARHVGHLLVGDGREALEEALGAAVPPRVRIARAMRRRAAALYLGAVTLGTAVLAAAAGGAVSRAGGDVVAVVAAVLLSLVPASAVAVGLLHAALTTFVRPRLLPRMDYEDGIPADRRTVVAVPTLLATEDDVREAAATLETAFLGNGGDHVAFAMVTDLADADAEEAPGDAALLAAARRAVADLSARHGGTAGGAFVLVHRPRRWNEREGRWMGWERKRGKLVELDRLLLRLAGDADAGPTTCEVVEGDVERLRGARYVVTLDADTVLPPGAAASLVAVLAHPLHEPAFDADGEVVAGYTVLQPRVETWPPSAARTPFSRWSAGDRGLDLYTHAVSDVYQDLFGEGIYAGKGAYDVAAFERSLAGRVPDDALLSHDLFEGVHGRAALVTDVALFEDYPPHPLSQAARVHRWTRGDWQLLPWLLPRVPAAGGERRKNPLSAVDRWKVFDNLRRSLLAPACLATLLAGWTLLPGAAWAWTAWILAVLATPIAAAAVSAAARAARPGPRRGGALAGPSWGAHVVRWALAVAFLPYDAFLALDAIGRTLVRLVTRKRLLQWACAAAVGRALGDRPGALVAWRRMAAAPLVALAAGVLAVLAGGPAWIAAAPLLVAWAAAPAVAHALGRPSKPRREPLREEDARWLRLLARRTWLFFERFTGPEDHWLPPDHVQDEPVGTVARRTSPTNVGLGLASTLAAWDLGYVGPLGLAARVRSAFETLDRLERHRGHFLNWYSTSTLAPLAPRYVSTVDSGNLAACLLVLGRGLAEAADAPVVRAATREGLRDTAEVLAEAVARVRLPEAAGDVASLLARLAGLRDRVATATTPAAWALEAEAAASTGIDEVEASLVTLVESAGPALDVGLLGDLRIAFGRTKDRLRAARREVETLVPWLRRLATPPAEWSPPPPGPVEDLWTALRAALPEAPPLRDVPAACAAGREALRRLVGAGPASEEARAWAEDLDAALSRAAGEAARVAGELLDLATEAAAFVEAMDFRFLLDERRGLFHIGYDVGAGRPDSNHYDLLASEARLASWVAIAKGDVPESHWVRLGRPFARKHGGAHLLSWAGTAFEYLMPSLFLRTPEESFLARSCDAAIAAQVEFARERGTPWGMSESAYDHVDAHGTYQYRAFGVPGLALKREPADRVVVAPYASALALPFRPRDVVRNLRRLAARGLGGRYGLYEAIDFGPPDRARPPAIVRAYMAHHQGMLLLSVANALTEPECGGAMVRRFHADPASVPGEPLLHERVPREAPAAERWRGGRRPRPRAPGAPSVAWWSVPAGGPVEAQVLGNGRFTTVATSGGGGGMRWKGLALTRWRADATLDAWGTWVYVRDLETGAVASAGRRPTGGGAAGCEVRFAPHAVEYGRRVGDVLVRMDVVVPPGDDVEVRRLAFTNEGPRPVRLEVTSYGEVVLAPGPEDLRHPAFAKLFVEAERLPGAPALLFRRRPRSRDEPPVHLVHALVAERGSGGHDSWETDRARFLGRGGTARRPAALPAKARGLTCTTGATLDPVFSIRTHVEVEPGGRATLAFATAVAGSRDEVLALAESYRSFARIDHAFEHARVEAARDLQEHGIAPEEARLAQALATAVLFPHHPLRAPDRSVAGPRKGREALWGQGISGDLPLVVVRAADEGALPLVAEAVRAHAWVRRHGVETDLVVLDEQASGYAQPLRERVLALVAKSGSVDVFGRRGGVFPLSARLIDPVDRAAIEAAAHVVLDGALPFATQLERRREEPVRLPGFVPAPSSPPSNEPTSALPRDERLLFDVGLGGFTEDGREYVVRLEPGKATPAPWVNVVANEGFGFLASESGGGGTWAANSSENRLTPWRNDPVSDEPREALYLRDEETAAAWTPTALPAGGRGAHEARHGAGVTVWRSHDHGLRQEMRVFAARHDPVKVVRLVVVNEWKRPRRVTATYFAEWVLGTSRQSTSAHVVTEVDAAAGAVLARNPFAPAFGARVAFLAASQPPHGVATDRTEFLGHDGGLSRPAALRRIGLSSLVRPGADPCAALQVHLDVPAGGTKEVHFVLGQGGDRADALRLVARWRDPAAAAAGEDEVRAFWDDRLGRVRVRTPDPSFDLLVNRWLLYQTLSCRVWGRAATYQAGGAFGYRDQLQDVLALLAAAPEVARAHLLEAARRQFPEGDVLHWWHPGLGAGVRTRCSDDLLWLPFAVEHYVRWTGDDAVLDERVPFLAGDPLREDERERYAAFPETGGEASLFEHCVRAIERGWTKGPLGLPKIGTGDWNDGMNRVGVRGRGESVWLGWFVHGLALRFASLCDDRGDDDRARGLRRRAADLRRDLEAHAWDGEWWRRATYDDGTPLGSSRNREGRIDLIVQAWAVLAGASPGRAARGMESAARLLLDGDENLVRLLAPPYDRTVRDPGYVRGYPPGIRENGGQYAHAAVWAAWAFANLGDGDRAMRVFKAVDPVHRARTPEAVARYRVEPYAVAGDVYTESPHAGRGGWTWYTGAAGWLYRLALERILGLSRRGDVLLVDPRIPTSWPGFEVDWRHGKALYRVRVDAAGAGGAGAVARATLDGKELPGAEIPLEDDGREHDVRVTLAAPEPAARGAAPRSAAGK